ncbi:MAG: MBL fold metallo-hydrolase [Anaerolineae bacterium]
MSALGVHPGELAGALVTHIHLDHAGAAGWLAARASRSTSIPLARRTSSTRRACWPATRIWGDRTEALWGRTLSAPADPRRRRRRRPDRRVAGLDFRAIACPPATLSTTTPGASATRCS